MADHGVAHQTGSMDIKQHQKTWHGFTVFVKYSAIGIAIIMVLLAMFRTN
jgi:hypothetical protein